MPVFYEHWWHLFPQVLNNEILGRHLYFKIRLSRCLAISWHVCLYVCHSVCLSVFSYLISKLYPDLWNFLYSVYVSPVAVAQFSDDIAIHHIVLVLSMTSCFHTMGHIQINSHIITDFGCRGKQCIMTSQGRICYPWLPCFWHWTYFLLLSWVHEWAMYHQPLNSNIIS